MPYTFSCNCIIINAFHMCVPVSVLYGLYISCVKYYTVTGIEFALLLLLKIQYIYIYWRSLKGVPEKKIPTDAIKLKNIASLVDTIYNNIKLGEYKQKCTFTSMPFMPL